LELNYKEFGQGDPIIILHGLFGTLDNWQTIAKKLAEKNTVFILDQRNHGKSPHTEEFNYNLLAEDLYSFMTDHWIYSAIIIGHSMGGKVAMQFAMNNPDMVEKLIVIDVAPVQYERGHDTVFEALDAIDLNTLQNRKDAEIILNTKLNNDFGTVQFLLKNLSRDAENVKYEWKMNYNVLKSKYAEIIKPIEFIQPFEAPTLFVRGSKSDYILDAYWDNIKIGFPKAKLTTIADAGHWVHADKPLELFTVLENFIST
jgi:esterase